MTRCHEPISMRTSWGDIRMDFDDNGVVRCALPRMDKIPTDPFSILHAGTDRYSQYVQRLFDGGNPECPPFGNLSGTPFQKQVWDELRSVPHGSTLSYGGLAERIGSPTACRAVANACGRNPAALFIPCHRIITAAGDLGGFSGGTAWKRLLLAVEQLNHTQILP